MIGRHFYIDNIWFVVARNGLESETISKFKTHIEDDVGKPSVYYENEKGKQNAIKLQEAYSTGDNDELREKFNQYKL